MTDREFMGTVFRLTVAFLEKRGLLAQVSAAVSPETRALLAKPPGPLTWMPAKPLDEVFDAVRKLAGSAVTVELGLYASRELGTSFLAQVIKAAFAIFGTTPATLYANVERFYPIITRGYHFRWEPQGDHGGVLEASWTGDGIPSALFDVTRGNLQYVSELTKTGGEISAPEVVQHDATGAIVRYHARW